MGSTLLWSHLLVFHSVIVSKPAPASKGEGMKIISLLRFREVKNRFGLHLTFRMLLQVKSKSNFKRISFSAGGSARSEHVSPAAFFPSWICGNWSSQKLKTTENGQRFCFEVDIWVYNATWNDNHKTEWTNLLIIIAESTLVSQSGHCGVYWAFLAVDLQQHEIKTQLTPSFHFHALSPRSSHSNDNCLQSAFIRRHSLSVRLPHQAENFERKAHRRHSRDVLAAELVSRWKRNAI